MKKTTENLQGWTNAITFAEAGEWDTARRMMPKGRDRHAIGWLQKIFMAAAFAEEGMQDEARRIMNSPRPVAATSADAFLHNLGLGGIRMTYGVCAI